MRGFQEIKGQSIRLVYDCERADFLVKTEPHLFVVRKPTAGNEAGHKNANRTKPARRAKC
jgi:uncharacterized Fe-S cluster protein YjdI